MSNSLRDLTNERWCKGRRSSRRPPTIKRRIEEVNEGRIYSSKLTSVSPRLLLNQTTKGYEFGKGGGELPIIGWRQVSQRSVGGESALDRREMGKTPMQNLKRQFTYFWTVDYDMKMVWWFILAVAFTSRENSDWESSRSTNRMAAKETSMIGWTLDRLWAIAGPPPLFPLVAENFFFFPWDSTQTRCGRWV
jgi:hypothetical protein